MAGTLLIFDGDCAFCSSTVERLRGMLPRFPEAQPSQWTDLEAYGLTRDDVTHYVWLVTPTHQYAGHLALAGLLRLQRSPGWRFLGVLLTVPPYSWIGAVGYKLIARFRHLLPGGTPACAMKPHPA